MPPRSDDPGPPVQRAHPDPAVLLGTHLSHWAGLPCLPGVAGAGDSAGSRVSPQSVGLGVEERDTHQKGTKVLMGQSRGRRCCPRSPETLQGQRQCKLSVRVGR